MNLGLFFFAQLRRQLLLSSSVHPNKIQLASFKSDSQLWSWSCSFPASVSMGGCQVSQEGPISRAPWGPIHACFTVSGVTSQSQAGTGDSIFLNECGMANL